MKRICLITLLLCSMFLDGQVRMPLQLSHDSTVHITAADLNSSGTGFFVSDTLVLTCLHVVITTEMTGGQVRGKFSQNIHVITSHGEDIIADLVSIPSDKDSAPLEQDFAFLRLRSKPTFQVTKLELASDSDKVKLGDDVYYSGFPLATPGMVSLKGMVAGWNDQLSLIFIQGPVNKGNSGGGLVDAKGKVLGLVSMREGGITQGMALLRDEILKTKRYGGMTVMGIDPLESTRMLIDTVDQYISVGLGYARDIKFARAYLAAHPALSR